MAATTSSLLSTRASRTLVRTALVRPAPLEPPLVVPLARTSSTSRARARSRPLVVARPDDPPQRIELAAHRLALAVPRALLGLEVGDARREVLQLRVEERDLGRARLEVPVGCEGVREESQQVEGEEEEGSEREERARDALDLLLLALAESSLRRTVLRRPFCVRSVRQ